MPGIYDDHLIFEVMDTAPSSSSSSSSQQSKNKNHPDNHHDNHSKHHATPTSSVAAGHGHGEGGSKGGIAARRGSASAGGSGSGPTALGEPIVTYTYRMPLKMTVTGCPLVIEQNTVGMSYVRGTGEEIPSPTNHNNNNKNHGGSMDLGDGSVATAEVIEGQGSSHHHDSHGHGAETTDSPSSSAAAKGQALLLMGKVCLNSDPLERVFRVKNEGCKPGKIKWKIRSLYPEIKNTVGLKTDIIVGENGKITSKIQFWNDVLRAAPFTIEPKAAIIPPYTAQTFRVVLTQTNVLGKIHAILTAKVEIEDDNVLKKRLAAGRQSMLDDLDDGVMSIASEDSLNKDMNLDHKNNKVSMSGVEEDEEDGVEEEGKTDYTLTLLALGDFSHPAIRLDKTLIEVSSPSSLGPTVVPQEQGIILKTQAPSLLNKSSTLKVYHHTFGSPCKLLIHPSYLNILEHQYTL